MTVRVPQANWVRLSDGRDSEVVRAAQRLAVAQANARLDEEADHRGPVDATSPDAFVRADPDAQTWYRLWNPWADDLVAVGAAEFVVGGKTDTRLTDLQAFRELARWADPHELAVGLVELWDRLAGETGRLSLNQDGCFVLRSDRG